MARAIAGEPETMHGMPEFRRARVPVQTTGGDQFPLWGAGARELFDISLDDKLMAVSLKVGADAAEPSSSSRPRD